MNNPTTITLNGSPHAIHGTITLANLLEIINLASQPVVIELNQHAVFPRDYAHTLVTAGDHLEIVTLAAGG